MSFRFRLESVERLRELQFTRSLSQLALAIREEVRLRAQLRDRQSAVDAASHELRVSPGNTTHAAALREQARRAQALSAALADARTALSAGEANRAKAQEILAKSRAELDALHRLEARARDEYWAAQNRLDQKRIDELASSAHRRPRS